MSKKYYNRSRNKKIFEKNEYMKALMRMLPIFIMVGVVPLLMRLMSYENGLTAYSWFGIEEISYEVFLIPKATVLTIIMFIMALNVGRRWWKEKRKLPYCRIMFPLFLYGLLVILSSCFSVNHAFSFAGSYEQFESVWVLLCYVIAVYYVYLYAQTEEELLVISDAIGVGTTVVGVIGTLQGIGYDIIGTPFVQALITSKEFRDAGGELQLNFGDGHAYATMYNPNYLGVFGSLVLPYLATMILLGKRMWRRIWHGAAFVLMAIAMLSSRSRAGLLAVIAALVVALLLSARIVVKLWYLTIPAINLAVVILLLVNAYNDNIIFSRLENIFAKDSKAYEEYITEEGIVVKRTGLEEMYTTTDGIVMTFNGVRVLVSLSAGDINVVDEMGNQVKLEKNEAEQSNQLQNPALKDVTVSKFVLGNTDGIRIKAEKEWDFIYDNGDNMYWYIQGYDAGNEYVIKESEMIMAEAIGFEDMQSFFSGRGYIWSRTIPLLKDHIFLGSGPDTFLLEFPQEDYVMMRKNGYENAVMTKPHSMYLQIGVQTGVLSLVCILVFYIWYAVQSIKLYAFRKLGTQVEAFGMAAFIGSIGYMISGISNDSMVVTAPVFWGMIGLGVAANVMVQKARKEEVKDNESENGKAKAPMKKQTGGNKKR